MLKKSPATHAPQVGNKRKDTKTKEEAEAKTEEERQKK
jgi:hypothetical protein